MHLCHFRRCGPGTAAAVGHAAGSQDFGYLFERASIHDGGSACLPRARMILAGVAAAFCFQMAAASVPAVSPAVYCPLPRGSYAPASPAQIAKRARHQTNTKHDQCSASNVRGCDHIPLKQERRNCDDNRLHVKVDVHGGWCSVLVGPALQQIACDCGHTLERTHKPRARETCRTFKLFFFGKKERVCDSTHSVLLAVVVCVFSLD